MREAVHCAGCVQRSHLDGDTHTHTQTERLVVEVFAYLNVLQPRRRAKTPNLVGGPRGFRLPELKGTEVINKDTKARHGGPPRR